MVVLSSELAKLAYPSKEQLAELEKLGLVFCPNQHKENESSNSRFHLKYNFIHLVDIPKNE